MPSSAGPKERVSGIISLLFENWPLTLISVGHASKTVSLHKLCQGMLLKTYQRSCSLSKFFPSLEDVVMLCRNEESATNTEADLTPKPVLNAACRSDLPRNTSLSVLSGPRKTPGPRQQSASIPSPTLYRFCGVRSHRANSECPAYGTICTACNQPHYFAEV